MRIGEEVGDVFEEDFDLEVGFFFQGTGGADFVVLGVIVGGGEGLGVIGIGEVFVCVVEVYWSVV